MQQMEGYSDWRKDCNITDASQKCKSLYFFVSGIRTGRMIRKFLHLCIIHDPQGIYYGGTIAAPVVRSIFENILPYLGVDKSDEKPYNQT